MATEATAASVLGNDDLLLEILLRLPPLPSSLPRASLVCKRWRRLLSGPTFVRRFRAHHRKPPMLGFFVMDLANWLVPIFTPTLGTPDRIPPARFSFPKRPGEFLWSLGCRDGLALLINRPKFEAVVWDPIAGSRCSIAYSSEFELYTGAVLRDCGSNAFKVVMIFGNVLDNRAWACLYESGSAKWGDMVSTAIPSSTSLPCPAVLVGKALCWVLHRSGGGILEYDTERQSLAVISMPQESDFTYGPSVQILRTEDGGLGLAIMLEGKVQLWERTTISDRGVGWVLKKTIDLERLISLKPPVEAHLRTQLVGADEVNNVIILWTAIGVYMIQLESMKLTILSNDSSVGVHGYFPYTSFYTSSGLDIGGGDDRAKMLDDTRDNGPDRSGTWSCRLSDLPR